MLLINCKIALELSWAKDCVLSNTNADTKFKTTSTKLYVSIVTLSSKDNIKPVKLLEDGFNRSVYWNEYQKKEGQEIKTTTILQGLLLILFLKELKDCLFLLFAMMAIKKL